MSHWKDDKDTTFEVLSEEINPTSTFEYHILQCCRAPEFQLRKWLKKALVKAGFELYEDNYRTDRTSQDPRYGSVHNLLAVRGRPKVCLVSHTDTCREHSSKNNTRFSEEDFADYEKWMGKGLTKDELDFMRKNLDKPKSNYRVTPVVKTVRNPATGEVRRVIQDQRCKFQVGGDDRLGVAIISWIALNSGYDMALYFPTDEEIGLRSAQACEFPELKQYDLLCQVDRGNHSRELVTKIHGEHLCSTDMAFRLLEIAYEMGCPRVPVQGGGTDVYALKKKGWCKNAVNMTCGYHNSQGDSPNEYIEISEARETLRYVSNIVKDFYLRG